eukprot:11726967-Alexandrium_andersonii.AAC.1
MCIRDSSGRVGAPRAVRSSSFGKWPSCPCRGASAWLTSSSASAAPRRRSPRPHLLRGRLLQPVRE